MTSGAADDPDGEFQRKLASLVGTPTGSGAPAVAPDEVNAAMIRHWAYALDDMNPAYLDADFAARSRFGSIVSPPVMLQSWTMQPPVLEGIADRGGVPVVMDKNPLSFFDDAGFTGTIGTNSEFAITRYPKVGDAITATTVIDAVSDEKKTGMGVGHFVTWVTTYVDADGEVLGTQKFRILKFRPAR